jgi:hypothetical protein
MVSLSILLGFFYALVAASSQQLILLQLMATLPVVVGSIPHLAMLDVTYYSPSSECWGSKVSQVLKRPCGNLGYKASGSDGQLHCHVL